jgi:hypothetical protein
MRNLGRTVIKARTRAKLAHVRDRTKQLRASLRTAASAVAELAKYITIGAKITLSAPQRAALDALAAEHHTYHEAWKGDLETERTHRRGLTPARSDSHIRGARTRAEREEEADSLLAGNLEPLEARIFYRLRARLPFKATRGASRLEVFLEYLHNHSHEYSDQANADAELNEAELQKAEAEHYADHGEHVTDDPTDETVTGAAGAWRPTSIYRAREIEKRDAADRARAAREMATATPRAPRKPRAAGMKRAAWNLVVDPGPDAPLAEQRAARDAVSVEWEKLVPRFKRILPPDASERRRPMDYAETKEWNSINSDFDELARLRNVLERRIARSNENDSDIPF